MPLIPILLCLLALMASQAWMIFRVRRQDKLVNDLGKKSLPEAVQTLIEQRYAELLAECVTRQPDHEAEHIEAHGGQFTSALRIEAVARRLQRKIAATSLPPLPADDLRHRAKEALCRLAG